MHLIKSLCIILTLTACKNVKHGQDDTVKKSTDRGNISYKFYLNKDNTVWKLQFDEVT